MCLRTNSNLYQNDFLRIEDNHFNDSSFMAMSTAQLACSIVKLVFPYLNKKDLNSLACSSKILNNSVAEAMHCENCGVFHKFLDYKNAQLHWCLLRGGYTKNLCSCGHYKDCSCYTWRTYQSYYEIEEFDEDVNFDFGIDVNM